MHIASATEGARDAVGDVLCKATRGANLQAGINANETPTRVQHGARMRSMAVFNYKQWRLPCEDVILAADILELTIAHSR